MSWVMCLLSSSSLAMLSLQVVEYLAVVRLKTWVAVTHSEVSLDLVDNRLGLEVGNDTFVFSVDSLIVVNTFVASG